MKTNFEYRSNHIDILKGVSIILIVAFHICGAVFHSEPKWFRVLSYQGIFGFFIASGFGLALSLKNTYKEPKTITFWLNWFKRRLLRIIPLYWIALLLTFASCCLRYFTGFNFLSANPDTHNPIFDFIVHALFLHTYFDKYYYSINAAWWFLGVIVSLYLLVPFLNYLLNNKMRILISIFLIAVVLFVQNEIGGRPKTFNSFIFFLIGMNLAYFDMSPSFDKVIKSNAILFSSISISLVSAIWCLNNLSINVQYMGLVLSFCFLGFIYTSSIYLSNIKKNHLARYLSMMLIWIGVNSYAIFLAHRGLITPIILAFNNLLFGMLVYFIAVLVLSYYFTQIDDKIALFLKLKQISKWLAFVLTWPLIIWPTIVNRQNRLGNISLGKIHYIVCLFEIKLMIAGINLDPVKWWLLQHIAVSW